MRSFRVFPSQSMQLLSVEHGITTRFDSGKGNRIECSDFDNIEAFKSIAKVGLEYQV